MLRKRLAIIIKWIEISQAQKILDIGTDHGLLAYQIIQKYPAKKVVATDLRSHIVKQLQNRFPKTEYKNLDFIVSDGFQQITDKFDLAVLAGLGVPTIAKILNRQKQPLAQYIIQTKQNPYELRCWFAERGFGFQKDEIILDHNQFYHTVWVDQAKGQKFNLQNLHFGNYQSQTKQTFVTYWKRQLMIYQKIMGKLPAAERNKMYREKIHPLQRILKQ